MTLVGVEEALAEAAKLLGRARDSGASIFHIAHDSGPGSPYDYSAPIGQIAAAVAPARNRSARAEKRVSGFMTYRRVALQA